MFWNRKAGSGAACLLGLAAVLLPAAASAAIVVASSGPSASQYPAGTKIPANTRITLKAGDSVTVLDESGTRVLRGAGTVDIGRRSGASGNSAFAALTRQRSSSRVRTGAVRGGDTATLLSPNLWYVDARREGNVCILDPRSVQVWRADSSAARTLRVTSTQGAGAQGTGDAALDFPAGEMIAPWDTAATPIADGSSYTIGAGDGTAARQVTFAVLPRKPRNAEDAAALLIEKGCSAQLELLASSLGPVAG